MIYPLDPIHQDKGVANNTVVALIGDHGWQLGEHNIWGKHTNFEAGTRVPLIIHSPGE
jgi:arylsulfatase A-like enzyme